MAAGGSPLRRSRWRPALAVLGVALLFGVLEAAQGRFQYREVPAHLFWPEALARALPSWILLVALFPALRWLARAAPIDHRRWPASLPLHAAAGGAFVLLHLGGMAVFGSWRHGGDPSFGATLLDLFTRWAMVDYFTYWSLIGMLHVWRHHSEMRDRELAEAALRADLSEARLTALHAQLQPHFLFNALNAIATLAHSGDRETTVRAVTALSDLLRAVLDRSETAATTLASEMEIVDRYLEIQCLRFGDRLSCERTVEPQALSAMVPTLILQPIVENAIAHGVGARRGNGHVAIHARRDGETLELEVRDSVPGFPREILEGRRPAGIGLGNTRRRLEQLYGAAARIECRNHEQGGALVSIRLPWSGGQVLPVIAR